MVTSANTTVENGIHQNGIHQNGIVSNGASNGLHKKMVQDNSHPLDPLRPEEIVTAKNIILQKSMNLNFDGILFATITNKEPPKELLIRYEQDPGNTKLARIAFCVFQVPLKHPCVEAYVNIDNKELLSLEVIKGKKSALLLEEFTRADDIVRNNKEVQKRLMDREIPLDKMVAVAWPMPYPNAGNLVKNYDPNARYVTVFMYFKNSPLDNLYAHALDFNLVVDVHRKEVVTFLDCTTSSNGKVKLPTKDSNFDHELFEGKFRSDIKPLHVIQPEGPSFKVHGNFIEWQKWQLRIDFNSREGLVIHNVAYNDGGKARPIAHRLSIAEMVVPYGDPNPPFNQKCALDIGDAGVGKMADSLELGCDCLGQIKYFDYYLPNDFGDPQKMEKVVCLHEEDAGLSWKHVDTSDFKNFRNQSRRSRRLVISFVATVINYEYAFYWHFYQDGNIGCEIKLTGVVTTNYPSKGENQDKPGFGNLVGPLLNAQHHQHIFCARLDMAVDDQQGGKYLKVSEVDAEPLDAEDPNESETMQAFIQKETYFKSESEAQRLADPYKGRYWKVSNPNKLNSITNKPIAYKLMSHNPAILLAKKQSPIYRRGYFGTKSLWVTPHDENELYPSGMHTIEAAGGQGMEEWVKKNRSLEGKDPVMWSVFGVTHFVRPEDFPVMPVETVGFMLKPVGFFNENPALDIPHGSDRKSTQLNGCCN